MRALLHMVLIPLEKKMKMAKGVTSAPEKGRNVSLTLLGARRKVSFKLRHIMENGTETRRSLRALDSLLESVTVEIPKSAFVAHCNEDDGGPGCFPHSCCT